MSDPTVNGARHAGVTRMPEPDPPPPSELPIEDAARLLARDLVELSEMTPDPLRVVRVRRRCLRRRMRRAALGAALTLSLAQLVWLGVVHGSVVLSACSASLLGLAMLMALALAVDVVRRPAESGVTESAERAYYPGRR